MSATTTYNQIANEYLKNLGLETCAAGEDLLQDANEEVAEGGADEHSIQRHLGDARAEVVAVLADIVGDPRSQQFLQTGEHTRGEHLRAQRVLLELEEVGLLTIHSSDQCRFDIIGGGGETLHTWRYPAAVFPPVNRSPTRCTRSSGLPPPVTVRTVSSWNLTDIVVIGGGWGRTGFRRDQKGSSD